MASTSSVLHFHQCSPSRLDHCHAARLKPYPARKQPCMTTRRLNHIVDVVADILLNDGSIKSGKIYTTRSSKNTLEKHDQESLEKDTSFVN